MSRDGDSKVNHQKPDKNIQQEHTSGHTLRKVHSEDNHNRNQDKNQEHRRKLNPIYFPLHGINTAGKAV